MMMMGVSGVVGRGGMWRWRRRFEVGVCAVRWGGDV